MNKLTSKIMARATPGKGKREVFKVYYIYIYL